MNGESHSHWSHHPLVVTFFGTVIGGLIATGLTLYWEGHQRQQDILLADERSTRAIQATVLQELPSVFQSSAGAVSNLFQRIIWLAEAKNQKKSESEIKELLDEVDKFTNQAHAQSAGGLFALAAQIFRCKETTKTANGLVDAWGNYKRYVQELILEINKNNKLDPGRIDDARKFQKGALETLNGGAQTLWKKMGLEVRPARFGPDRCVE